MRRYNRRWLVLHQDVTVFQRGTIDLDKGIRLHAWEPLSYLFRLDQEGAAMWIERIRARGKFLPVMLFFHFRILWAGRLLTELSLHVLKLLLPLIDLILLIALLLLYPILLALQELTEMGFVFERCWRPRQIQLFWLTLHSNVKISLWHGRSSVLLRFFGPWKRSCHL